MIREPAGWKLPEDRADHEQQQEEGCRSFVQSFLQAVYGQQRFHRTVDQPEHESGHHQRRGHAQVVAQTSARLALDRRRRAPGGNQWQQSEQNDRDSYVEHGPVFAAERHECHRADRKTGEQKHSIRADQSTPGVVPGELIDPDIGGDEHEFFAEAQGKADREPRPDIRKQRQENETSHRDRNADRDHPDDPEGADQPWRKGNHREHGKRLGGGAQAVEPRGNALAFEDNGQQRPGDAERDADGHCRSDTGDDAPQAGSLIQHFGEIPPPPPAAPVELWTSVDLHSRNKRIRRPNGRSELRNPCAPKT